MTDAGGQTDIDAIAREAMAVLGTGPPDRAVFCPAYA
jgi:hypothetical protein